MNTVKSHETTQCCVLWKAQSAPLHRRERENAKKIASGAFGAWTKRPVTTPNAKKSMLQT